MITDKSNRKYLNQIKAVLHLSFDRTRKPIIHLLCLDNVAVVNPNRLNF
jgi:hypothetical protein